MCHLHQRDDHELHICLVHHIQEQFFPERYILPPTFLTNMDFLVNVLVLPKQVGGSDFWKTTDEAQLGTFSADNPGLTLVGTIHTHPGFDSTPSSVDLH